MQNHAWLQCFLVRTHHCACPCLRISTYTPSNRCAPSLEASGENSAMRCTTTRGLLGAPAPADYTVMGGGFTNNALGHGDTAVMAGARPSGRDGSAWSCDLASRPVLLDLAPRTSCQPMASSATRSSDLTSGSIRAGSGKGACAIHTVCLL